MKTLLKVVVSAGFVLSFICCTSEVDEAIFDETRVAIEEEAKTLGGGEEEHDPCRKDCE
ncbi:hypothetical protein [Tunicatimonas pelagia]|uniref:hypothetical protein n=1 Tax=Tunicatimonas pelagia TaxID=931531 RepID=UPI002665BD31|nr:hypothetical protein [Tunicatimonas pelagia]WKN45259.1 hypothetical protein P0M28_09845 [Tunicatimonas pelagia]